eukprot:COSAG01_NODE_50795_length_360_cov_0.862069_2_plen_26_part_01
MEGWSLKPIVYILLIVSLALTALVSQ